METKFNKDQILLRFNFLEKLDTIMMPFLDNIYER